MLPRPRVLLVLAAVAVVALLATACLPASEPVTSAVVAAPTTTAAPTAPAGASIVKCPVNGFIYGQGFGPTHSGIDMGAPLGTPVYAVRSGTLWYWSTNDVGGYSVYLKADDGNTYYYTHLAPYYPLLENTTRKVTAGDVIEFVDHTGNANGYNHLHFELRLGGPNGTRVDPWPSLVALNCA
jgi:murein DD-endopeptidase MepM/ murein hydrolase activator NlpD